MPTCIRLLRHATLLIEINNKKILVDPMLSPKNGMDPVQNCGNQIRFPMVDLPITETELSGILKETDAIAVTHLHRDHWDNVAQKLIPKDKTVFCQPPDSEIIREEGFQNVNPIEKQINWEGIRISRTGGQHGTGDIEKQMGKVSGFVFAHENYKIYVAGDSIWCPEVERALTEHRPQTIVLNTGGARFLTGDPITMTADDVAQVYEKSPHSKIIAVHMDTVNHCFIRRTDLLRALKEKGIDSKILIPEDGEIIAP